MRRPKPKPKPPPTEVNFNLNIGGGLNVQFVHSVPPPPVKSLRAMFTAKVGGFIVKGPSPMAYTLAADKMIEVAVSYEDAQGNEVDLSGAIAWETSDDTILIVQVSNQDDHQCAITPTGTLGNAQVTCTGNNPDGSQVIATLDVNIVSGNAITGRIQPVGDPQPIPQQQPNPVPPNAVPPQPGQPVPPSAVGPQSRSRR